MADQLRWLFVDFIPLLHEKRRVARQFKIEMWLDPSPIMKELGIEKADANRSETAALRYIV